MMQVTCPRCKSVFKLPDGLDKSSWLRCSVCQTSFPLEVGNEESYEQEAPEGAPGADMATEWLGAQPKQEPQEPQEACARNEKGEEMVSEMLGAPGRQEQAPAAQKPATPPKDAAPAKEDKGPAQISDLSLEAKEEPKPKSGPWRTIVALIVIAGFALLGWKGAQHLLKEQKNGNGGETVTQSSAPVSNPAPKAIPSKDAAKATTKATAKEAALTTKSLDFHYKKNANAPSQSVLAVRGFVYNTTDKEIPSATTEVSLKDKNGKFIAIKSFKIGPILSDAQLSTLSGPELEAAFNMQPSVPIPPHCDVPFTAFFFEWPNQANSYSINVRPNVTPCQAGDKDGKALQRGAADSQKDAAPAEAAKPQGTQEASASAVTPATAQTGTGSGQSQPGVQNAPKGQEPSATQADKKKN